MQFLKDHNVTLVAEIGVNHEGSFDKAKELVTLAAGAGADWVKFQSYTPEKFASANDQERLKRVKRFALSKSEFFELSMIAKQLGIGFFSTAVTEDWVDILDEFCPAIKIASGDITFMPVIEKAATTGKPVLLSTGAATISEIDTAVNRFKEIAGEVFMRSNLILLHCISAYPAPIEQANLRSIPFLKDRYGLNVGFSNHVIGMEACLAAVALGARVLEVHFTDVKEGRDFRDHALSMNPREFKELSVAVSRISSSLGDYTKNVQPCEQPLVPVMRKGIVAASDLQKGKILESRDLAFARPATHFNSSELTSMVGKKLLKDVRKGHLIEKDMI